MAYTNESRTGEALNEYLYSTVGVAFSKATLAQESVDEDDDGNRVLRKGTVLADITSGVNSGKVGPYDSDASDGRETKTNILGICDVRADVTRGDLDVGYLYRGVVKESKVYSDGTQGSLDTDVKSAMRSESIDILFR